MPDDGFNFRPAQRREAKRFEPPPWEQGQFDEIAQQRAEQEAAEQRAVEAAEAAAARRAAQAVPEVTPAGASAEVREEAPAERPAVTPAAPSAPPALDDRRVTAMLAELAAEEPGAPGSFWKANVIVGGMLAVFGLVFVIWGMAGLVATKGGAAAGMMGGVVLLLFGGGFVAGGLYVAVKALRQRGVL